MSSEQDIFDNLKKQGNQLIVTAIEGNLPFEQKESLILRAIDNFMRAPIYDQGKLNDVRCSSINNNKSVAYIHLIKASMGENQ